MPKTKTALVTGASGYIAKHIVRQLLDAGWNVRGSVRSQVKADQTRKAMQACVQNPETLDSRLSFVILDLSQDAGWDDALTDADALLHTASPFPLAQPKDEDEIVRPAVDGVLRALTAAKQAEVARVVMTSSSVAVMSCELPPGQTVYTEDNWTDINHPTVTPYIKSKTLAERAAWDFVAENPEMQLTCINPVFVQGTPLDADIGTSIKVIKRILDRKDPAVPDLYFPAVDVRDIATMHVKALSTPESIGNRIIGSQQTLSYLDFARTLDQAYPDRKIITRVAPHWLIKIMALFDPAVRGIIAQLGVRDEISNARAGEILDMEFHDARQAIRDSARFLIENDMVT
jgi:nucleoside-diphosphate-sugar epimerase